MDMDDSLALTSNRYTYSERPTCHEKDVNETPFFSAQDAEPGNFDQEKSVMFEGSQKKREFNRRQKCFWTSILLFGAFVAAVIISLGFLYIGIRIARDDNDPSQHQACVACTFLKRTPTDWAMLKPRLTQTIKNGVSACCGKGEDIKLMLDVMLKKEEIIQDYIHVRENSSFQFSHVSAHKQFTEATGVNHVEGYRDSRHHTLSFNTILDHQTEHARGVIVSRNGFIMKHTGLYYIYSSIVFKSNNPEEACKTPDSKNSFLNCVMRSHPRNFRTDILLRTEHTCCQACTVDYESSYTGGIFLLNKDDIISSEISSEGKGYFQDDSSFMGLIMLGTESASDSTA